MRKYLITLSLLLPFVINPAYAGLITHTDYQAGNTITAAGQNSNENTIYNEFNGNIDNSNIKPSAGINLNKLSLTDNVVFVGSATFVYLQGTTTNDNAPAGAVGESTSSVVTVNSGSTGQWNNITSVQLSSGDWDTTGQAILANVANVTGFVLAISTVSGGSQGTVAGDSRLEGLPSTATSASSLTIAAHRVSLTANTTFYLESNVTFSGSTPQLSCRLSARRIR